MPIFWRSIIVAAFVSFFPIPANPKILKLMNKPPAWIFSFDGYTSLFKKAAGVINPYIKELIHGAPVVAPEPTPARRQSVRPIDRPLSPEVMKAATHIS
jgi:hypothetical protein